MDFQLLAAFGTVAVIVITVAVGFLVMVGKFYRKVDQGRVLIISKTRGEPVVTYVGGLVFPIVHRAEVMDISVKTIEIDRRGKEGLICRDNIRADIKVTFFVRVNKNRDDVLRVAQAIGCARASDQSTVEELFGAKFSEALKTVGKRLDFVDLYQERDRFRDQIIEVIGKDLNGYVLEDAAIDFLEQTPLQHLDKDNILDAEGIRKVTELTTQQNVITNELRQSERKAIKKQDVEAEEAVLALDRQQADAEAKQKREILSMRAREEAETAKIQAEERKKSELAKIKTDEEILINEQNKLRQIEVAQKNRQRVIAVETERVEKDRALEAIVREREVELNRIAKEKEIEVEKKAIADVIRTRIVVDKTVAEEEERIKDLRAKAAATRDKDVLVITAEAQAREKMVMEITSAEASQEVAKFRAKERLTLAEAELEASDKAARSKMRLAEGTQATVAAEGLAQVKVKEADAVATEKLGLAEARVTLEKMQAQAVGDEKQGLARVKVKEAEAAAVQKLGTSEAEVVRLKLLAQAQGKEADAAAVQKLGLAEAEIARQKHLAEATGVEQKGLAGAKVQEAEAAAREKLGLAEAAAVKEKLLAEAVGLAEKATAMKALDGVGREHEEFRIQLEKEKAVEMSAIDAKRHIAEAQAMVLSEAFKNAKIQIVGGDGAFFDRFIKAVSLGQSVDGIVDNSGTVQKMFKDYLGGEASLSEDLRTVFSGAAAKSKGKGLSGVQKQKLSSILGKLAGDVAEPAVREQIRTLAARAEELGIDDVTSATPPADPPPAHPPRGKKT